MIGIMPLVFILWQGLTVFCVRILMQYAGQFSVLSKVSKSAFGRNGKWPLVADKRLIRVKSISDRHKKRWWALPTIFLGMVHVQ